MLQGQISKVAQMDGPAKLCSQPRGALYCGIII